MLGKDTIHSKLNGDGWPDRVKLIEKLANLLEVASPETPADEGGCSIC